MKNFIPYLIFASIFFVGCKDDEFHNTPDCILEQIEELKLNSICDDPNIKEYIFQGMFVYVVESGTCGSDISSGVYDSTCEKLGDLGGFPGNTEVNGENFDDNAEFKRLIWQK